MDSCVPRHCLADPFTGVGIGGDGRFRGTMTYRGGRCSEFGGGYPPSWSPSIALGSAATFVRGICGMRGSSTFPWRLP
jgi:hypothetical protein